jgi:hypothetical protein
MAQMGFMVLTAHNISEFGIIQKSPDYFDQERSLLFNNDTCFFKNETSGETSNGLKTPKNRRYVMKIKLSIIILIITGGIFLFSDAIAQRGAGMGPGPGLMQGRGMVDLDQLDLTREQRLQIADIMARYRAENRLERGAWQRGRGGWTGPQRGRAVWADPPRDEIMEVLTPAQRERFNELRTERQLVRRQFSETYSRTMIENYAERTGLDAGKKARIIELTSAHQKSMQALRDAEISGEISRIEFRNKSDELRLNHRKAMQEVLTEEEYLQWQNERRGDRPGWYDGWQRRSAGWGNRPGRRGFQRGYW